MFILILFMEQMLKMNSDGWHSWPVIPRSQIDKGISTEKRIEKMKELGSRILYGDLVMHKRKILCSIYIVIIN